MYVQGGQKDNVQDWVDAVHNLRYKDYQLVAHVARCESSIVEGKSHGSPRGGVDCKGNGRQIGGSWAQGMVAEGNGMDRNLSGMLMQINKTDSNGIRGDHWWYILTTAHVTRGGLVRDLIYLVPTPRYAYLFYIHVSSE